MDTGLKVKPAVGAAQSSDTAARRPVVTELAPSQTVNAAANAAGPDNNPPRGSTADPMRSPYAILDAQSREVIDRTIGAGSRRISRQVPEVAVRRLKAYSRPAKRVPDSPDARADIEV
jgi:hypothetical protein